MPTTFPKPSLAGFAALALGLVAACHISFAVADTLSDIQGMIKQGQLATALEKVNGYLVTKPKDAPARFLKGVILSEMGRPTDAIAVYSKLTEDYPNLPEPYNNLAVLYAQQKQVDKARIALEMAIKTHPSYAVAHENLGDLYAQLASQSYDKALQRDSTASAAPSRLAPIQALGNAAAKLEVASGATATAAAIAIPQTKLPETSRRNPESRTSPAAQGNPVAAEASAGDGEVARMLQHWRSMWSHLDFSGAIAYSISDLTCRIMRERVGSPGLSTGSTSSLGVTGCRSEPRKSRFW